MLKSIKEKIHLKCNCYNCPMGCLESSSKSYIKCFGDMFSVFAFENVNQKDLASACKWKRNKKSRRTKSVCGPLLCVLKIKEY